MEKYLLAPLLISKLGQDDGFRSFFSRLLRALAAFGAVAAFIVFFLGWKDLFEMSSEAMIGGILYQLTFAVAAYLAVHYTLLRAAEAKESAPPEGPPRFPSRLWSSGWPGRYGASPALFSAAAQPSSSGLPAARRRYY